MSGRTARRLAASGWLISLILLVAAHATRVLVDDVRGPEDITLSFLLIVSGLAMTYSTVGGIVAARRPANPIGWIFLGSALSAALILAAATYAEAAMPVPRSGPLPGADMAAFTAESLGFPTVALVSLVFLLYPDGRLLSRRWRPAGWLVAAAVVSSAIGSLAPGRLGETEPPWENPLGIEGAVGEVAAGLRDLAGILLQLSLLLGVVSMFVRYRRSRGEARLQLKWFVLTIGWIVGAILVAAAAVEVAPATRGASAVEEVCFYLALAGIAALPVTAAVAILRYRLYDIDVVINRTLVYGVLTAALALTYLVSVLVLQLVLSPGSDLAVAGSTLTVAALFQPVRRRVQAFVDRRFYRRRYDAQRTLEGFGTRLRDEIDLDALGGELRGVVAETVQPAHLSLWLRNASRTPPA